MKEYVTPDGKSPFRKWLHALRDVRARAKVRVRLNRVRLGNFGDVKAVGGGVLELRIPYGVSSVFRSGRKHSCAASLRREQIIAKG